VTLGTLTEAGGNAARLRVDCDLAAVDQVRALPGLALQPGIRVAARNDKLVAGLAFRRRPRPRLRQPQLRPLALGSRRGLRLQARFAGQRFEAGAQAPQRRVRLGVEAIDREMAALDQPMLLAQRNRVQEEPLEHLAVGEPLRLRLRDRLVRRQPLAQPIAEKEAQIKTKISNPQQLPHRTDPLQRPGDHQLQQHRRVDRRPANGIAVVRPRRLTDETPVADDLIDPAKKRSSAGTSSSNQTIAICRADSSVRASPIATTNPPPVDDRTPASSVGVELGYARRRYRVERVEPAPGPMAFGHAWATRLDEPGDPSPGGGRGGPPP
jgi:hypothetical protein